MAKKPFVADPVLPKPWKGTQRSKLYLAEENQLHARIRGLEEECVRANRFVREREAELFKTINNIGNQLAAAKDENVKLVEAMATQKLDYESKINALLAALVAVTRVTSPREPS
jgi:hypothetical protein